MQTVRPHPRRMENCTWGQQAVSARPLGNSDVAKVELICCEGKHCSEQRCTCGGGCDTPVAQAVTTVIRRQESVLSSDSYQRT